MGATTRCPKCGCVYDLQEDYETDTWNLGHYGCNLDNAPKVFKGYKDPGCPHCLQYENIIPFSKAKTIPYPVNIQLGAIKTHREMKDDKLIVTQEQKMEFNIDFNLIQDYIPITSAQKSAINKIEWNTSHKFKGKSREDASEFIEAYMAESLQKVTKRRRKNGCTRSSHLSNITDEDCDTLGYDASMFY